MSEELKPCPFCGNDKSRLIGTASMGTSYRRWCKKCNAMGPNTDGMRGKDGEQAWNTRTTTKQQDIYKICHQWKACGIESDEAMEKIYDCFKLEVEE